MVCLQIAPDDRQPPAQFLPVASIAFVPKTAEPLETVGLTDDGSRPYHLPTLAPGVARSTDLIEPTMSGGADPRSGVKRVGGRPRVCHRHQRLPTRSRLDPLAHPSVFRGSRWSASTEEDHRERACAGRQQALMSALLKSARTSNGRGVAHAQTKP